jgi:ribosomal protein S18 acetylase RimI-like enzyme
MAHVIVRFDADGEYVGFGQFDCGHPVINRFVRGSLRKQVRQGLSVAWAIVEETREQGTSERFVGFYTIASHAVPLSLLGQLAVGSLPRVIPCMRLIMLGVDHRHARLGLGRQLVNHALDLMQAEAQHIGCYGLYLDADPGAVGFYRDLGFHLLEGDRSPSTAPMFITLSALG